ncbi:MAG: esterase YqiA, partial [Moraxellaceae bacterium]
DYRQAVKKYAGCKQTVEEGGDHSFQNFERYLDSGLAFLSTK